ncbi:hypothetical protein DSCO28_07450 [Desulfosarcina ovata subsp. sediminis]|uniref:Mu-like prophage FluMu protein gp29 n=1 Tax=Desulfosarcina ovata subsp. sediminis TaxID=885957 RepID=A0A5K7ZKK5_9BACT|nr:DUF935 family protein [Desulfosarcina ovata]BBO80179.1 hypothetical protein DSCO28_07450 [Desulfosarcina ovata subsp. sediminis]
MKLYISPTQSVDLDKNPEILGADIAIRSRSMDWWGMFGYLPDPDPVLAKLGLGVEVYRELLADAHVWSCYDSRKSGALACEWDIRAGGDSPADKKALSLAEDILADLDVYQLILEMLDAPFFGLSPMEIKWAYTDRYWLPERVEGKPPEWFVFDDLNRMRFLSADNMIDGELLPHGKFLKVRHHATYQNPYGERTLSRCFWPVAFKKGGFKFWAVFTEKFGMPWLIGKVPRGTGDPDRAQLISNLTQMVQDAVAVINDDESITALEFKSTSASADIYERLISASNREISKAVLGQTLSTELDGKGGSRAAAQAHLEVRDDIVEKDKRMVRAAMNQLLAWSTELNVPEANPPEFAWFEEDDVQQDRAKRDTELTSQGVRFTAGYYQRAYNLEEDDFTLDDPDASETLPDGLFAEGTKQTDTADRLADRMDEDAAQLMRDLMDPARNLVMTASSLEEIRDGLIDLFPHMDASDLGTLMQQAMTVAELAGRSEVADGE